MPFPDYPRPRIFGEQIFPGSNISASFHGTGSGLTGIISSSYAVTASYAENGGGGALPEGVFSSSIQVTHNSVSGLQGGTTSEYYHLTSAEYAALGGASANIIVTGSLPPSSSVGYDSGSFWVYLSGAP